MCVQRPQGATATRYRARAQMENQNPPPKSIYQWIREEHQQYEASIAADPRRKELNKVAILRAKLWYARAGKSTAHDPYSDMQAGCLTLRRG